MSRLDEILAKKSTERENREKELQQEVERENKRKEREYLKRMELIRINRNIARNKASFKFAIDNALIYGFWGAIIGALLGFGKGCKNYNPGVSSLAEPFLYIPENALNLCIAGLIIGVFAGIIKGQTK